ncbi:MAG: UDP-glucose/GDP-mannose dehydrogenase family protein [Myxococcales bacterium]|nr:UDP-glucose/GDP-mannose dehydrogenase family protein [Myxococcota bacterium]MDW8280345.1 UDP-glucose/GDP-mannose dehydrogenase family protein [Myxococcales bacterium]
MQIAVIGTGYVGLVVGCALADFGNEVTCADLDAERIAGLRAGQIPFFEPGLGSLLHDNLRAGRLRFTADPAQAAAGAEVIFIAVGTPGRADGSADTSQVLAAAQSVAPVLSGPTVLAIKSTVPVGTTERVREAVAAITNQPFAVVANPEFLKEGNAVEDFLRPMRVIVGVGPGAGRGMDDERVRNLMRRVYAPMLRTSDRLLFMDARSAELTKYACNAYLATRVSFINDVAALCERMGADVEQVRRGMGMDVRIGPHFLFPGIGFGGSCLPKDLRALQVTARQFGLELPIVAAAAAVNARQPRSFLARILGHFGANGGPSALRGRRIAVWGLAFKPETDDLREAPSLSIIQGLLDHGAQVAASDPAALPAARRCLDTRVELHADAYEAAQRADALVLCTEWRQYRQPDFLRLRRIMAGHVLFDGRNQWDPAQVRELGFCYYGIGRP